MRVLIIGIDALEHFLVEEWNLKHLKQKEYGTVRVPLARGLSEPSTEIVWPCFITGQPPRQMGYDSPILYRQPYKWLFEHFYAPFTSSHSDIHPEDIIEERSTTRRILDQFSSSMMKAGLFYHPTKKDITAPTLFDNNAIKSAHFHIPVYDNDAFPFDRKLIFDVLNKTYPASPFLKTCKQAIQTRCQELNTYLTNNTDWQLVMMYFFTLDAVQHAFYNKKLTIMDFYLLFNNYIGTLKKTLPKNTLLLIISDHGQKKGIHTLHGFYSSNKKLKLHNPDITTFKPLIENLLEKKP